MGRNALEILMPYTIYNSIAIYYICWHCWHQAPSISNAFNAMYVDTVDTNDIHICAHQSMQCIECYVCPGCRYTGVCGSYTTPYTEYYEVWKHQYWQSRHSIAFNALHALIFVSTVSTNKIPYSIHNSIVLILCIDHLNMPFTVMYIRTTM